MSELLQLEALGPSGPYRTRNRLTITDLTGAPTAELSLVPRLFVQRGMSALHRASAAPADERARMIAQAGQVFATGTIGGLSINAYQQHVSRVSGMPISAVRYATAAIASSAAAAYRSAVRGRPDGSVHDWRDPLTRTGDAVWTRRDHVLAVHAPGNEPAVHTLWLEALALGYRVAVRPSKREPFTPHRLIIALRESGFGADHVMLLPTDHAVADDIIRAADRALVYGSEQVVNKYSQDNTVLSQGPGRSKILLAEEDWQPHLDTIIDSVTASGGMACIDTTAVFVEGDPTPLAEAIAERLSAIPSLPPDDDKAVLPAQTLADAKAMEKYLLDHAGNATPHLGGDGIVDDLGDGTAVMRPAVFRVDRSDAPQTGIELPFPCVWVAPWCRADDIQPLKNTLVLTAINADEALIDQLIDEPTISNVYIGDHPTHWIKPGIPHDGYIAEFLMRTKAMIRD
jgi:acyl-CoA reductase-like NAD-dependent aldehyde dehydrogenase